MTISRGDLSQLQRRWQRLQGPVGLDFAALRRSSWRGAGYGQLQLGQNLSPGTLAHRHHVVGGPAVEIRQEVVAR